LEIAQKSYNSNASQFSLLALKILVAIDFKIANSIYVNVVKGIAETDIIFVHGESLVEYLFQEATWTEFIPQILPIIFRLEKFLKMLHDMRCQFKVVFFESDKFLWESPLKRLVRDIVKLHIEKHLNLSTIHLHAWWVPEWSEIIRSQRPALLFVCNELDIKGRKIFLCKFMYRINCSCYV
jgi:hypothetical protein